MYAIRNPNIYALAIVFDIQSSDTFTNINFRVFYNASIFRGSDPTGQDFWAPQLLYLERGLEEAMINTFDRSRALNKFTMNVNLRPFPKIPPKIIPDTLSSSLSPCFVFIITALPAILMALNAIVDEKKKTYAVLWY